MYMQHLMIRQIPAHMKTIPTITYWIRHIFTGSLHERPCRTSSLRMRSLYDKDTPDRQQKVAGAVEGEKSAEEFKSHSKLLVKDLEHIESGCIPIPDNRSSDEGVIGEERFQWYFKIQ